MLVLTGVGKDWRFQEAAGAQDEQDEIYAHCTVICSSPYSSPA
jgi:hypothetical protein